MTAAVKPRWRNTLRSTIGLLLGQLPDQEGDEADRPRRRRAARSSVDSNQSCSLPRSSISCSAPTQTTSSDRPMTSIGALARAFVSKRLSRRQRERRADERDRHVDEEDRRPANSCRTSCRRGSGRRSARSASSSPRAPVAAAASPSGRCAAAASATAASAGRRTGPAGCGRRPACRASSTKPQSAEKTPKPTMAVVKTRTAPKRPASQPVSGTRDRLGHRVGGDDPGALAGATRRGCRRCWAPRRWRW